MEGYNEERKKELDQKFQEKELTQAKYKQEKTAIQQSKEDPDEDPNVIHEYFSKIEEQINQAFPKYKEISLNAPLVESHHKHILSLINDISEFINAHSFCLNSYDQQNYQHKITALIEKNNNSKKESLPKPKFTFSSKSKAASVATKEVSASATTSQVIAEANPLDFCLKGISKVTQIYSETDLKSKENIILENISDCTIIVLSPVKSAYLKNITNSLLLVSAINGGCLIYGCTNSVIVVSTHQLRIHDSISCKFLLQIRTNPIIESCSKIEFGTSNALIYKDKQKHQKECGLWEIKNEYSTIMDFKWLKKTHSPNWTVMAEEIEKLEIEKISKIINI